MIEIPRACSNSIQSDFAATLVRTRLNGAGQVHCACVEQEFLSQRRLSRVRVRNNGKGAPPKHFSRQFFGRRLFNRQRHGRPPPTSEQSTLLSSSRRTAASSVRGWGRLQEGGLRHVPIKGDGQAARFVAAATETSRVLKKTRQHRSRIAQKTLGAHRLAPVRRLEATSSSPRAPQRTAMGKELVSAGSGRAGENDDDSPPRHCRLTASPASANVSRHWALTVSRPFTNLTCIILHVVNLIILRVADLTAASLDGFFEHPAGTSIGTAPSSIFPTEQVQNGFSTAC